MKKLLLILICLFISFEVRSSDDLTGKNLICEDNVGYLGFEFISKNKVTQHTVFFGSPEHDTILGDYSTTIQTIDIFIQSIVLLYYSVRRDTLKIIDQETNCIVYEGEMKEYFSQKSLELKEYFKRRNKL